MKKVLIIVGLILYSLAGFAQTGTGWSQQRAKVNFKDSVNIASAIAIGANKLTLNGQIFTVDGGYDITLNTDGITSINLPTTGTLEVVGHSQAQNTITDLSDTLLVRYTKTQANGIFGRKKEITSNLSAGIQTDITLTGVTTAPYSIHIEDSNGLNITDAVKDSTGVSGGVYHTYIYSVDAKTNAKIKVLW